jgi:hypothetical protein
VESPWAIHSKSCAGGEVDFSLELELEWVPGPCTTANGSSLRPSPARKQLAKTLSDEASK